MYCGGHVPRWLRQETAVRSRSHARRKLENRPPRSGAACVGSVQLLQPAAVILRCFFPLEVVAEKCANFNEPAGEGASSGEPAFVAQPSWRWVGWAFCLAPHWLQSTGKMPVGPTGNMPVLLTS